MRGKQIFKGCLLSKLSVVAENLWKIDFILQEESRMRHIQSHACAHRMLVRGREAVCGRTCCFVQWMLSPGGWMNSVSMEWLLYVHTPVCTCTCLCAVHLSVCLCLRLKAIGNQVSHRSISFLLWQSGDLRCMASCDPDSFLLSPSAPPHWHSGMTSERRRHERESERRRWGRAHSIRAENENKEEDETYRSYCQASLRLTWEQRVIHESIKSHQ